MACAGHACHSHVWFGPCQPIDQHLTWWCLSLPSMCVVRPWGSPRSHSPWHCQLMPACTWASTTPGVHSAATITRCACTTQACKHNRDASSTFNYMGYATLSKVTTHLKRASLTCDQDWKNGHECSVVLRAKHEHDGIKLSEQYQAGAGDLLTRCALRHTSTSAQRCKAFRALWLSILIQPGVGCRSRAEGKPLVQPSNKSPPGSSSLTAGRACLANFLSGSSHCVGCWVLHRGGCQSCHLTDTSFNIILDIDLDLLMDILWAILFPETHPACH